MPDQGQAETDKPEREDAAPTAFRHLSPSPGSNPHPQQADHRSDGAQRNQTPTYKTIWREIRWLDILNAVVGICMLIVALATYRVASDTRDVKNAVRNISTLATQTKRQADDLDAEVKTLGGEFGEMQRQTGFLSTSANAAQGQLAEMRAEQRAWVSVAGNPTISEPLNSDANGIRIELNFILKNGGKNPAVNAFVNIEASAVQGPSLAWQKSVCRPNFSSLGTGIFAGDGISVGRATYIKQVPTIGIIWPIILACVIYRDGVTGRWHHTPYVYRLSMNRASLKQGRGCCSIILSDLPIDGKDLFLAQWPMAIMLPD